VNEGLLAVVVQGACPVVAIHPKVVRHEESPDDEEDHEAGAEEDADPDEVRVVPEEHWIPHFSQFRPNPATELKISSRPNCAAIL
jgi:hypothetical protein